jgi:hypothetical protein
MARVDHTDAHRLPPPQGLLVDQATPWSGGSAHPPQCQQGGAECRQRRVTPAGSSEEIPQSDAEEVHAAMITPPPRVSSMFRNRERMVKILGVFLAVALVLGLILPFLVGGS